MLGVPASWLLGSKLCGSCCTARLHSGGAQQPPSARPANLILSGTGWVSAARQAGRRCLVEGSGHLVGLMCRSGHDRFGQAGSGRDTPLRVGECINAPHRSLLATIPPFSLRFPALGCSICSSPAPRPFLSSCCNHGWQGTHPPVCTVRPCGLCRGRDRRCHRLLG